MRPLSFKSTLLYLYSKFKHEIQYENYQMDMLRMIAAPHLKEIPERYYDIISNNQKGSNVIKTNYTPSDVIDMFLGKGKLVESSAKGG